MGYYFPSYTTNVVGSLGLTKQSPLTGQVTFDQDTE